MSHRAHPGLLFLAACLIIPSPAAAQAAQAALVGIQEEYDWPGRGALRCTVNYGDLLLAARSELHGPRGGIGPSDCAFGASLPWVAAGPLLTRGMLRLAADPMSFFAWSGVFDERTGVVLDSALRTSRAGVALMPLPGYCGIFCRAGTAEEADYGAFGRLPLGAAAAAECALLVSRPDPAWPTDEWFLARSPFPGGDITHFAARLVLDSPILDFSFAAGASTPQLAAPGAFTALWIRGRLPEIEGALLLSGATPGYRAPDGAGTTVASRVSGSLRLGRTRSRGSVEAGFSVAAAEHGFSPGRETPTRTVVRAAFSRDIVTQTAWPISLLLDVQKDIRRDSEGIRQETSRCGATTSLSLKGIDVAAGAGVSDHDGVDTLARLSVASSAPFRLGMEARGCRLGTSESSGTMTMKLVVQGAEQVARLAAGLEDIPLDGRISRPLLDFLTVRLSCTISFNPTPPRGPLPAPARDPGDFALPAPRAR